MKRESDILIVGGGVVGLCAAVFLAESGASVTLVERDTIPCGSSRGNAGLIVPSHCEPLPTPGIVKEGVRQLFKTDGAFSVKLRPDSALGRWLWRFYRFCNEEHYTKAVRFYKDLGVQSLALHRAFAEGAGDRYQYQETGLLHLYLTEKALAAEKEHAGRLEREFGISSQILSGDEIRHLDPSIGTAVVGGVGNHPDGRLHPASFLQWLAERAQEKGAQILSETEVYGFDRAEKRVKGALTTRGEFYAEKIVIAAGAWSGQLTGWLDAPVPIQGAKGYSLTFKKPGRAPLTPLFLEDYYVAITPFTDHLRMTGFLEFAGLDPRIDPGRLASIRRHVPRYLPELGKPETVEVWRGFRPCAPDGLPTVGRLSPYENLWISSGHATKGLTLAPITGKILADMIAGKRSEITDIIDPNRFGQARERGRKE